MHNVLSQTKTKTSQRGFSLIELMVVIAIIAILSVIGISGYSSSLKKGRDARRKSDIQALAQALTQYRMDWSHYPDPDTEYWVEAQAALDNQSGLKAFGPYTTLSQMFDPASKTTSRTSTNYNENSKNLPYVYICQVPSGSKTCRAYLVCAKMESQGAGNFIPLNPTTFTQEKKVTNVFTQSVGRFTEGTSSSTDVDLAQWYCAQSY